MLRRPLYWSLITFGISFGISLLIMRDAGKALLTGGALVPAMLVAVRIRDRQAEQLLQTKVAKLKRHLRSLEQQRASVYASLIETSVERDELSAELYELQEQVHQLESSLPQVRGYVAEGTATPARRLSWDIAALQSLPPPMQPSTLVESLEEPKLQPPTSMALGTEPTLASLQVEFQQLQRQVAEQRQLKAQLRQEVTALNEQTYQQQIALDSLSLQIQHLEQRKVELNQTVAKLESAQREPRTSSHSLLPAALKQLQTQVTSLQAELQTLETDILSRRQQKQDLEQDLSELTTRKQWLEQQSWQPTSNGNGNGKHHDLERTPVQLPAALPIVSSASTIPTPASLPILPAEWTEFLVQLSDCEFQALKAIATQEKPVPQLKQIAEAHLTMPELLIDAINERSLDMVGDMIVAPGTGTTGVAIVQEHRATVQALIQAYEYLNAN